METFDSGKRTARKEHKCNFCNGVIKKGEEYQYSVHKDDEVYTWKSHINCSELVVLLDMEYDYEGITGDEFCEYLSDYIHSELSYAEKAVIAYDKIKGLKDA